jgi:hypothetical protein
MLDWEDIVQVCVGGVGWGGLFAVVWRSLELTLLHADALNACHEREAAGTADGMAVLLPSPHGLPGTSFAALSCRRSVSSRSSITPPPPGLPPHMTWRPPPSPPNSRCRWRC